MNFLLIPDKFKGSLTASQVIDITEESILEKYPDAQVFRIRASDGGDGFLDSIMHLEELEKIELPSFDALGRSIDSYYLLNRNTATAYVELANTSGLVLLEEKELDPLNTSTYGTGIQIKDALDKGAKEVYIGLGGSATNDGGIGIAAALGYEFLNKKGESLPPIGANLGEVTKIDTSKRSIDLSKYKFYAVNDVTNPLLGKNGATYVYGKQKGGNQAALEKLEKGLENLDKCVVGQLQKNNATVRGAGAAGGSAYGLMSFLNASFINGIMFVLHKAGVPEIMKSQNIDYIITGEGKVDGQSLQGKLVDGIFQLNRSYQVPIILICGVLEIEPANLYNNGVSKIVEICDREKPLQYSMENASRLLRTKLKNSL